MGKIRLALVGVGNNASALVQGCRYYAERPDAVAGLRKRVLAGYDVADIEFACAFDVARNKVGLDLSSAVFAEPNNFPKLVDIAATNAPVLRGILLDSITPALAPHVPIDGSLEKNRVTPDEVTAQLLNHSVDVLLSFLPTGSPDAAKAYALAAAGAKVAFVNATPDPVVHSPEVALYFQERGVPLLGDDLESQVGTTYLHRTLMQAVELKGLQITGSYQVNLGGNMDFRNLVDRSANKAQAKRRGLMIGDDSANVTIVPAVAHAPFLGDRKVAHISVRAMGWLGCVNSFDLTIEVQDSGNAAGIAVDLVRIARFEKDKGSSGVIRESGFYFKNPLEKLRTHEALALLERYDVSNGQSGPRD